ncbi:MAG: hypothetical protein ACC707_00960 [Thiohalomonadales bacterium]
MTIERARELISVQVGFKGGYNRNASKLILAEVAKLHGQASVDQLIREFRMDEVFGFKPGTCF